MAEVKGKFVWYDLMTTDVDAAAAFYGKVVGWTWKDSGMPDSTYLLLLAGQAQVAGLMPMPEDAGGSHPHWTGYIGVDDVDAWTKKVADAGGSVHRQPWDVPHVGRMSVVGDPQGSVICLFTPQGGAEGTTPPGPNTPGYIGWHELHSSDGDAAWEFYSKLFGWGKNGDMDMGPAGTYHLFQVSEVQMGGMMTKMPEAKFPPMWLFYFNVDGIDAAVARIEAAGGKVLMGPHEVPGGTWIVQALDPQGGMFALASLKK
jgi:uncharacterized protein